MLRAHWQRQCCPIPLCYAESLNSSNTTCKRCFGKASEERREAPPPGPPPQIHAQFSPVPVLPQKVLEAIQ